MQALSEKTIINDTTIPLILQWWRQRKRLATSGNVFSAPVVRDVDNSYLQTYQRLMSIYTVVKSGGVGTQIEAAHAHWLREKAAITQRLEQLDPRDTQKRLELQQEADELEQSMQWRVSSLKDIHPEEEAVIARHMDAIEQVFLQ